MLEPCDKCSLHNANKISHTSLPLRVSYPVWDFNAEWVFSLSNHLSQGNPRRYHCEGQSRGHAVKILGCMLSISLCTPSTADSGSVYTDSLSGFPEDQPDHISRNETLCGKQILLAEAQHCFILYVQLCRAIMRQNKDRVCYLCTGAPVNIPE